MYRSLRIALFLTLALVVLGVCGGLLYRYKYPYGARPACLPVLLAALESYSSANGGNYPNDSDPLQALSKLHPVWLPDPRPLAGLSGDLDLLKTQIRDGSPMTFPASSWVYWPGLRSDDNPQIAIVWEMRSGVSYNGSRASGREVGFIGGSMRRVRDADWDAFTKDQARLRQEMNDRRNSTASHIIER